MGVIAKLLKFAKIYAISAKPITQQDIDNSLSIMSLSPKGLTSEILNSRHRELAKKFHPDKFPETERSKAHELFSRINVANDILKEAIEQGIVNNSNSEIWIVNNRSEKDWNKSITKFNNPDEAVDYFVKLKEEGKIVSIDDDSGNSWLFGSPSGMQIRKWTHVYQGTPSRMYNMLMEALKKKVHTDKWT